MSRTRTLILAVVALALSCSQATLAADAGKTGPGRTMIVLDASGSMWGRIDGRPKIEIAREALGELLGGWPSGAGLGLTVYGHRRKGDCGDIETLVGPGSTDPRAVERAAARLDPKGKTPLSAAVRRAAERLRHTEERANVILISDGRETCNADPCAVGTELERAGVNFTAHVIGFDVEGQARAGLRCLAENTGGRFFAANEAGELRAALGEAAKQVRETDTGVVLQATDRPNGPALRADGLRWTVRAASGGERLLDDEAVTVPELDLEPGRYIARVALGDASAEKRFEVTGDASPVHKLVLQLDASVDAPDKIAAGSRFEVAWQGPDKSEDSITVVAENADRGDYDNYTYTREGNPVSLRAPDQPGPHEVRYIAGQSSTTLARTAVEITPLEASLEAPEKAEAGSRIQVEWQGPDHGGDYVTIVAAHADANAYDNYTYTAEGSPLTLKAPDEPGQYELRYKTG